MHDSAVFCMHRTFGTPAPTGAGNKITPIGEISDREITKTDRKVSEMDQIATFWWLKCHFWIRIFQWRRGISTGDEEVPHLRPQNRSKIDHFSIENDDKLIKNEVREAKNEVSREIVLYRCNFRKKPNWRF